MNKITKLIVLSLALLVLVPQASFAQNTGLSGELGTVLQIELPYLTLKSPANKKVYTELEVKGGITFDWGAVEPKKNDPVVFRLQVWQLMSTQTGAQTMKSDKPLVEQEVTNQTSVTINGIYTGPCKPPYLCEFVWDVQAYDSKGVLISTEKPYESFNTFSVGVSSSTEGNVSVGVATKDEATTPTSKEDSEMKASQDMFIKSTLDANPNVKDIEVQSENSVSVGYRANVKLFGFLPFNIKETAVISSSGEDSSYTVSIKRPWYGFLFSKSLTSQNIVIAAKVKEKEKPRQIDIGAFSFGASNSGSMIKIVLDGINGVDVKTEASVQ